MDPDGLFALTWIWHILFGSIDSFQYDKNTSDSFQEFKRWSHDLDTKLEEFDRATPNDPNSALATPAVCIKRAFWPFR
jgi:hypothetical protein